MLINVSYQRRLDKFGRKNAILYAVARYGSLFLIGIMIMVFENKLFTYESGVLIIEVDIFTSIAFAGSISLILVRLIKNNYIRIAIGYCLSLVYQILLVTIPFMKWYAEHSIHGGIFGMLFGWISACIIASGIGDYLIISNDKDKIKFRHWCIVYSRMGSIKKSSFICIRCDFLWHN